MVEEYKGWFIDWIEQWSQFCGKCNWYTYNFIKIEFEDERILGGLEFTIILLGLGFRIRWNYKDTEMSEELQKMLKDIEDDT